MHILMKASFFVLAFAPASALPPPSSSSSSSSMFGGNGANFVEREGPVKCTLIFIEPYMIDPDAKETSTVACMLHPEYEGDSISGITYELYTPSFPKDFFKDVEYATTDLTISAALIKKAGVGRDHGGGIITMKNGATATKEFRGKGVGIRGGSSTGRRLAPTVGNSTLIVLYAIPLDASNSDRTSTQLANDIFGIAVNETQDLVNVKSQMLSCSRGKLSYMPACGTPEQSCSSNVNQSIWFKNGVLRVSIPYNVTGIASGTVKNWVEAEAQKILQAQTPKIDLYSFTQIMNVIPDAADWGGAAAWAYLPGQTSAFRNSYSWRMGVMVHEFGHNIGLHHSGFGTAEYADHSCMLGNPSYGDDGPEICFNGAKSWETGWYATDSVDVVPSSTAPFTADLIGAADWVTGTYTPGSHRVVLRITDSTVTQKYHIMYNRAKGPNAGVTFAKDKVTVTLGAPRQVSWHQAALGPVNATGNKFPLFRKEKFNGGNKTLVIKLCSTTAGTSGVTPDIASVMVYLDDGAALNNGFMCPGELPCINDSGCNDGIACTTNTCLNNTCLPVPAYEIGCTSSPTTLSPTSSPTTSKPTSSPTTRAPTNFPTTRKPTNVPTTRQPTNVPTTRQPTNVPTSKPTTSKPTTQIPTSKPTTSTPTTRTPTSNPTTSMPSSRPTTSMPSMKPTTGEPSSSPTGQPSTASPTTESPTTAPTTESPTTAPTTESPTTAIPTNS